MTNKKFDATFEGFLANIALTNTQATKLDSKVAEMYGFFYSAYGDDVNIYLQGSYATGTTVKPLTENQGGPGDYDVDIVIERREWNGAMDALVDIEELFSTDSDYADLLSTDKKESCVRLEFGVDASTGVGFHVDVVPILDESGVKKVARRTDNIWEESDSEALIRWTNDFFAVNPYAKAILLSLKRLRDVGDYTIQLTSIIMLSLMKTHYANKGSYFDDLVNLLGKINDEFAKGLDNISINNPINNAESLLKKWKKNPDDFEALKQYLSTAYDTLLVGLAEESTFNLREVLSTDFPSEIIDENVDSLRSEGLKIDLSGKLKNGSYIVADAPHAVRTEDPFELLFFERSKAIKFTATEYDSGKQILWQVNNARGSWDKRGNYFEAMSSGGSPGSSLDPAVNEETEQHLGRHWIRYVAVDGSTVYVISRPFRVNVMSSSVGSKPTIRM